MSRDIAALLDKHTVLPDEPAAPPPPLPKKSRGLSWKKCETVGCRRNVRSRNEVLCVPCRITYVPTVSVQENFPVQDASSGGDGGQSEFARLQELLSTYSAVQPYPEHLLLLEWDAAP